MSGPKHAREPAASPAPRRVLKAAAFIAAVVVACVAVEFALDAPHEGVAEKLRIAADSEGASSESAASDALGLLPEGFQEEVLRLEGREDVRVAAQGPVVGFVERSDAPSAFAALSAELEAAGWASVNSGRDDCGSFVKEEGRFTWLFVSCVWSGEATSVVITCSASEG